MARNQEEITKKCRFLRPFELTGHSLSAVDQSQNMLGTTSRMQATFSLCLRSIALIVFDFLCSQNLEKLHFLCQFERKPCSLGSVDHYENLIWSSRKQYCINFFFFSDFLLLQFRRYSAHNSQFIQKFSLFERISCSLGLVGCFENLIESILKSFHLLVLVSKL